MKAILKLMPSGISKAYQINNVSGLFDFSIRELRIERTVKCNEPLSISQREPDKKWFTNWNQSLLDKVLDYKRLNN